MFQPGEDPTLSELGNHFLTIFEIEGSGIIKSVLYDGFDFAKTPLSMFPLMVLQRTESSGDALCHCKATIRVILPSRGLSETASVRWVELVLDRAIRSYFEVSELSEGHLAYALTSKNSQGVSQIKSLNTEAGVFSSIERQIEFYDALKLA